MISTDPTAAPSDAPPPEGLVEVGGYATTDQAFEHGVVLIATGHPCWLLESGSRFSLQVEAHHADAARAQLAQFARESVGWPPAPPPVEETLSWRRSLFLTPLLWAIGVMSVFLLQNRTPGELEARGMLIPEAIYANGELWRGFTALWLHDGVGHVTSNVAFGIFVFTAVLAGFGLAGGWLRIAATGVLGNLAIAALRFPAAHVSLGASTAILGSLGLLVGRAARGATRSPRRHSWRATLLPLCTGAALFALFGTGEMRTDVGAHGAGFAVGIVVGFIAPAHRPLPVPQRAPAAIDR